MPDAELIAERPRAETFIPWYHQSQAERLMDRIGLVDVALIGAIRKVVGPHMARTRRKPHAPVRKERLIDLVREWRDGVPADSRLGLVVDYDRDKRGVTISDCRLLGMNFAMTGWDRVPQPGLSMGLIRLRFAPNDFHINAEFMAAVSKHALCRRFQRGGGDDAAVLDDLRRVAIQHEALASGQYEWTCEVPSGRWYGNALDVGYREDTVQIRRFVQVRTFLGHFS